MSVKISMILVYFIIVLASSICVAQDVITSDVVPVKTQQNRDLLGFRPSPGVLAIIKEIETKTGKPLYAEFREQPEFQFGASFIDDEGGRAIVLIDPSLENTGKKLEAVVVHELLHLRLTVSGYPSFLWSEKVRTAKGLAIDVEQSNINDLRSIIEHRAFRADMQKLGLYKYIDLAGDAAEGARNKRRQEAGQDDVINYVRAILEYHEPKDVDIMRKVYTANGWQSSIKDGIDIAAIIERSPLNSPVEIESVFLKCILKLYPPPNRSFTFKLTLDKTNKYFRRMIVGTQKVLIKRK